jgi:asparagine synthase (glutamine-hydrolysing)
MCGIVGVWTNTPRCLEDHLNLMNTQLKHRGPDDEGVWVEKDSGIGLGHRRLSIIDLTSEGHQPMFSACGRYVIVFNGEIYNHRQLKSDLSHLGQSFRGHSDTEVMLGAISQWGIVKATQKFVGMFAFAVWDRHTNQLNLVRDRIGEKPLYYGRLGRSFGFASELKALKAYPDWEGEIDRNTLALYIRYNYIPAPYSIYQGIYKLLPGSILTVDSLSSLNPLPLPVAYWSAGEIVRNGISHPYQGTEADAIEDLHVLLGKSVSDQMVADVPLGAFLSGGIDSSIIVALMQAQSSIPVKTFSIGFNEKEYNEANHAKAIAQHIGTDHTELYVTSKEAIAVIPKLPALFDEPFADSSQIPTFLVAQLAKKHVTVSLSGDGGDELFGGYNRYFWGKNIWKGIGWMPSVLRTFMASGITKISPQGWNNIFSHFQIFLPSKLRYRHPGDKLHKISEILSARTPEEVYMFLVSLWKNPEEVILNSSEPPTSLINQEKWCNQSDFIQSMMLLDTLTYLPDDILVKVDRACMGVSLESRVPFLDHRVIEFAWKIPMEMKMRGDQGKWILRQVLYKYIPKELIERPKMGFGVPIDNWLRGPLRDWAESLLDKKRLLGDGIINSDLIHLKWKEHISGTHNWHYSLWSVLMFQAWLDEQ